MKHVVLTALVFTGFGATAAYAAAPETVAGVVASCCRALAAACGCW